jgi:hypothetical protein
MFPKPRAPMITVPACRACNRAYEKDDVLFAMAMCIQAYADHPQALRAWEPNLRPMILRKPGLKKMLSSNMLAGPVRTPAGLILPDRKAMRFEKARIERIVRKIVRGLLWHHYNIVTPPETQILIARNPRLNPDCRGDHSYPDRYFLDRRRYFSLSPCNSRRWP